MPPVPYQFLSRISPIKGKSQASRADFVQAQLALPFESVVRSKPAIRGRLRSRSRVFLWSELTGVMEHHNDVVQRDVDVCRSGYGT
jgi:hypothetical protein